MKDFVYICLDLDGTLLDSSKNIGTESKRIIKDLREKEIKIILASGRHFRETKKYYEELGLTSQDIVIACDGQYIYYCDGTILWSDSFLTIDNLMEIQRITNADAMSIITDTIDYLYVKSLKNYLVGFIKRIIRRQPVSTIYNRIGSMPKELKVEKVILKDTKNEALDKLIGKFSVHSIRTDYQRVEILNKGVNKYKAIEVLNKMGIIDNKDNLVYFGNDMNDAECFFNLKYCVAMADSPEKLKNKAFMITSDCDHDGVGEALSKLF